MTEYWKLLRDPRWQRKRLEIMKRDGFKCVECGDEGETLNVHHGYYEKGNAPWEYPDESLRTLCETHHKELEENLKLVRRIVGAYSAPQLWSLVGYLMAINHHGRVVEIPNGNFLNGYFLGIGASHTDPDEKDYDHFLAMGSISSNECYEHFLPALTKLREKQRAEHLLQSPYSTW